MADEGGPLEFLIRLEAKIDEGLKLIRVLTQTEDALGKTDKALGRTEAASARAEKGHKKHADGAQHLTGILDRLVHAGMDPFIKRVERIAEFEFIRRAVDAILEAPMELIEKVKELGEELLRTAGKAEELEITFKALFGSEDAEKLLGYSDKIADKTNMTTEQIRGMMQSLGNAGFKIGDDMERALRAVSDLGALSGRGAAGAEEAASMLERLQNMGVMNPRMLNSFGISRKAFWDELHTQTGIGVETLKKQMEKGTVDIEAIKAALYTVITRKTHLGLGGLAADVGQDFNSRLVRLKAVPDRMYEAMKDSSGFKRISTFVGNLGDMMSPGSEFGKKMIGGLDEVLKIVGDMLPSDLGSGLGGMADFFRNDVVPAVRDMADVFKGIDWRGGAEGLLELLKLMPPLISAIAESLHGAGLAIHAITHPIETVKSLGRGLEENVAGHGQDTQAGRFVSHFYPFKDAAERARWAREASHDASLQWEKVDEAKPGWQKAGANAGAAYGTGMMQSDPAGQSADFGSKSAYGLTNYLQIKSPSKLFAHFGEMAASGYAEGLTNGRGDVEGATTAMVATPALSPGAGGRTTISIGGIHVHVTVEGHGHPADTADAIAERLDAILVERVTAVFEKAALEMGNG